MLTAQISSKINLIFVYLCIYKTLITSKKVS